jgi:uncharacterized protein (DUF1330 family)
MAVFYIGSYDVIDPNEFQKYPPLVMALLPKYGGEVLASDLSATLVEGTARTMNAISSSRRRRRRSGSTTILTIKRRSAIRQKSTAKRQHWCWRRNLKR